MPNPLYSQYLDFAPSFKWGGRSWGYGDQDAFRRKMGPKRYAKWARNHPTAARTFNSVDQEIYGAYQPELAAIDRERKTRQDYYGRLMKNLGGFTSALGPMLSGIPGAIQGSANQSGDTMTYGANSYGNMLNADQAANAAAGNVTLDAINSPAQLAGGDAGSVLAGYAGWIPSTMMKEQGAAWSDRAKNFPKEAALQSNLMMRDLLRGAQEDDKGFSGQITDVLSGLAGDRVKLGREKQDARYEAQDRQREWYLKMAALEMSRGNAARADQYLKLANQREYRYENKDRGYDVNGNLLPGFKMGPNGPVKIGTPKKPKTVDWGGIQNDMADEGLSTKGTDPARPWSTTQIDLPMDYKTAYQTLWAKYSGMVKDKKRLRRLINKILKSKGIVKSNPNMIPGKMGPPAPGGG